VPSPGRSDGCGFILFTCLVTCLLMVVNGGLVAAGYRWLAELGPRILQHPRVAQASLFLLPVMLLFLQWWFLDRLLDWLRPARIATRSTTRRRRRAAQR
jgi:hypothetical protein